MAGLSETDVSTHHSVRSEVRPEGFDASLQPLDRWKSQQIIGL
jgi:hypothetical protein